MKRKEGVGEDKKKALTRMCRWETCDAGKLKERTIIGVPVKEAKGYWCNAQ